MSLYSPPNEESLNDAAMIYKIKFISAETEGFQRVIEIDSDASFLDLNKIVLSACGFPDDQMTSFYVCDEDWERGQQITREDMGGSTTEEDFYVMAETRLSEFIDDEEQNLEFVFDPFSDRVFYMTVKEIVPGQTLKQARVVKSQGEPPRQIAELDFSLPPSASKGGATVAGDGEDAYFDDGGSFNDDELDLEGFEIVEGSELY